MNKKEATKSCSCEMEDRLFSHFTSSLTMTLFYHYLKQNPEIQDADETMASVVRKWKKEMLKAQEETIRNHTEFVEKIPFSQYFDGLLDMPDGEELRMHMIDTLEKVAGRIQTSYENIKKGVDDQEF